MQVLQRVVLDSVLDQLASKFADDRGLFTLKVCLRRAKHLMCTD